MLKPFFSRGDATHAGDEAREQDEMWALPDMEAAPMSSQEPPRRLKVAPAFEYEEEELPPAGGYAAELVGWQPLDARRIAWRFRAVTNGDASPAGPLLEFITGTVLRPDNHLCRLVAALGLAPAVTSGEPRTPEAQEELRRAAAALQPDLLLGRRCWVEVEHVEDELGNISARVARIRAGEGR